MAYKEDYMSYAEQHTYLARELAFVGMKPRRNLNEIIQYYTK
jgi:hypothetical protein